MDATGALWGAPSLRAGRPARPQCVRALTMPFGGALKCFFHEKLKVRNFQYKCNTSLWFGQQGFTRNSVLSLAQLTRAKRTRSPGITGTYDDQAFLTALIEGCQKCLEFQVWAKTSQAGHQECLPNFRHSGLPSLKVVKNASNMRCGCQPARQVVKNA